MRSRGLVVALALLLAVLATAGVFLYIQGVKEEAVSGGELTTVLVSEQPIEANTPLTPLLEQSAFTEIEVPSDALVEGAVTDLAQLQGKTTTAGILAGEQIPLSRLSGGALPGGTFGLKEGFQAVTVKLEAQQFVGQGVRVGDRISFYAWFDDGVSAETLRAVGFGNIASVLQGSAAGVTQTAKKLAKFSAAGGPGGVVVMAVPETRVLAVGSSPAAPATETTVPAATEDAAKVEVVTLELTPQDAQRLIFAQNEGSIWFGLIRPGDEPPSEAPVDFLQLVGTRAGK